ncbi:MAG: hypothetical protein IKR69_05450 [Bacteroidales bacterium]|nr:hypothetical protein [Bacteroidales bacterium]
MKLSSFRSIALTALTLLSISLRAEERDSLVTLVSAKSAQLIEKDGISYRKVIGPAKFFHNNTYLLCDTALWNVSTNIINCMGHVQMIQDRTRLKSETLDYIVDEDLAKFRGALVQLEDSDHNILRTRYLDYNTKDSVAVFQNGGAMRDKDGQIIESNYGTYDSKAKNFTFIDEVNMFTDSIFIKTSRLEYLSDVQKAYFGYGTDAWDHENMLSANDGWYDRSRELFLFMQDVHVLSEKQEGWSDSLYFYRTVRDVQMLGNAQLLDTTRNVFALAGLIDYRDTLARVLLTRDPAIMAITEEQERRDTVYMGADTLVYQTFRRCDVDSLEVVNAEARLKDLSFDAVSEYRRKAAEEAAKAAEEAAKNDPNRPPEKTPPPAEPKASPEAEAKGKEKHAPPEESAAEAELPSADSLALAADTLAVPAVADTLAVSPEPAADTLSSRAEDEVRSREISPLAAPGRDDKEAPADSIAAPADSVAVAVDSLALVPPDTTKIGFVWGHRKVKLYRKDIQVSADSLAYNELDSLIRFYRDPLVFNEGNRQYSADSIFVIPRGGKVDKAHLLSNAFIATEQDTVHYDQIKGTEIVAFFDGNGDLGRFDALGTANAMFFLEENGTLATVNKVESKMLSAEFLAGELQTVRYFDAAKNDAYPIVQLPREDFRMKGFNWQPERRPKGKEDITSLESRPSERRVYRRRPHARFVQTGHYFPGYIDKVTREIALRDSLKEVREREEALRREIEKDSLAIAANDSLSVRDTLQLDSLRQADTLAVKDSLVTAADSLATRDSLAVKDSVATKPVLTEKELRKLEKQKKKAEKQAALEAKWAAQDKAYAERQAAKEARAQARLRARKLRELRKQERKALREALLLEKYIRRYQNRKARK